MRALYAERSEASAVPPSLTWKRDNSSSFAALRTSGKCFLRFNLVSTLGIAVQLAALTLLTRCFGLNYLWATGLAVSVTVLHNFAWHERFTFSDRVRASQHLRAIAARFLKFNLMTGIISIGGNVLLMHWLRGRARLPLIAANLLAIAICGIFNYVANERFVFRQMEGCEPYCPGA
jgi:putative flippase GtrA